MSERLFRSRSFVPRVDPGSAASVPGTDLMGFDSTVVHVFTGLTASSGNINYWGPMAVFTVPDSVERAVVTEAAVLMEPLEYAVKMAWRWEVSQGAALEAQMTSICAADLVLVKAVAGMRWAVQGTLSAPQPVRIELKPSTVLQLRGLSETLITPLVINFYIRVRGYLQNKAAV